MAISLGELELKVKANIDEVKSQIQQLDGEQVEVTVSVETEGLTAAETRLKALEGTRTVTVSADTDESVEETKEETDALGGDRQATAKADTDDSVDTTKEAVDALGGDREANAKATEDETVATVQAAIDALGEDQEATAKAVEDESIATVQSKITALGTDQDATATATADESLDEVYAKVVTLGTDQDATATATADQSLDDVYAKVVTLGTDQDSTVTATEDGSVATVLADIEALGEDQDASVSATDDGTISEVQSDLDALSDDQDASVGAADDGTIASTQTALDALSDDQSASVDVSDNGTISAVVTSLGNIPETVDVTANVEQKITASISGVDTSTLESLNTSSGQFKDAADTLADSEGSGWIGKFGGFVGNLVTGIVDFGKSVVSFVAAQADTADEYATQATIAGMTTAEIYRLNWMAGVMDVEPQQIIQATREINTSRKTEDAWLASSAYQVTGLNYEEALGMSGFSIAEMVMKSIAEMPASEREMAAVSAFGGRGTQLLPMIAQMSTGAYDEYIARYSTGIYGAATSDSSLAALLELADAKDDLTTALSALNTFVASLLAPVLTASCTALTSLIEDITGILLDEEMTPEEKGKAIWESIKETFNTTVKSFQDWIDGLWAVVEPMLEAIGEMFVAIFDDVMLALHRAVLNGPQWLKDLLGLNGGLGNIREAGYSKMEELGYSRADNTFAEFLLKATPEEKKAFEDTLIQNFESESGTLLSDTGRSKFLEMLYGNEEGAFWGLKDIWDYNWEGENTETRLDRLKRQRAENTEYENLTRRLTEEYNADEVAALAQEALDAAANAEEAAAQAAADAALAASMAEAAKPQITVVVNEGDVTVGTDGTVSKKGAEVTATSEKEKFDILFASGAFG